MDFELINRRAEESDAEGQSQCDLPINEEPTEDQKILRKVDAKILKCIIERNADFAELPFYVFTRLIKTKAVRQHIMKELRVDCPAPKDEVDHWVSLSDKDQFSEFAAGQLTFAQLKRSIAQRRFGVEYMTVDDYLQ